MTLLLTLLLTLCILFGVEVEWTDIHLNEKNIIAMQQYDTLFYALEKQWQKELINSSHNKSCLVPMNTDPNYYPRALQDKTLSGCTSAYPEITINTLIEDDGNHRYRINIS